MALKALFIGGSGVISTACSELAVRSGMDLFVLNRGRTHRPLPESVHHLRVDRADQAATREALDSINPDVVVNFIAFTPEQVQADIDLCSGRTGQYVFISSASAYQTPPARLPIDESTPLRNPFWEYSRLKIACEERLMDAYRDRAFPVTVVRPSQTYDRTVVPVDGGWSVIERLRQGREIVVHGDGTSLWTLTHSRDFAQGLVGLLGQRGAIGQSFHITSDEVLTWNAIYEIAAHAAGTEPRMVHVPSDAIAAMDDAWGAGLLGDKAHSMLFDNTKIKRYVPDFQASTTFGQGMQEAIAWHDADASRRKVDQRYDALMDTLVEQYRV